MNPLFDAPYGEGPEARVLSGVEGPRTDACTVLRNSLFEAGLDWEVVSGLTLASSRALAYEVQRLASAVAKGRAAEKRLDEISWHKRPNRLDPADIQALASPLLKYHFALARAGKLR